MMPAGVEAVELAVQHVGQRGERVPVGVVSVGKRPDDTRGGQAAFNLRIFVYVNVVIEVDEIMAGGLAEDDPDGNGKEHAHAEGDPAGVWCGSGWSLGADAGLLSERSQVVCLESTRYECSRSGGLCLTQAGRDIMAGRGDESRCIGTPAGKNSAVRLPGVAGVAATDGGAPGSRATTAHVQSPMTKDKFVLHMQHELVRKLHRLKNPPTFAFTASSILISGGQLRKLSGFAIPFFVAAMPSLLPMAISLVAWSSIPQRGTGSRFAE